MYIYIYKHNVFLSINGYFFFYCVTDNHRNLLFIPTYFGSLSFSSRYNGPTILYDPRFCVGTYGTAEYHFLSIITYIIDLHLHIYPISPSFFFVFATPNITLFNVLHSTYGRWLLIERYRPTVTTTHINHEATAS